MEVKIVLGHTFGDEGKGVTTQYLCKKAIEEGKRPIVIRFSGGAQAGHTVVNEGITHICSSFGSGVLLGVPTYLLNTFYLDPVSLVKEYEALVAKGITPTIGWSYFCHVVTPYDIMAGQMNAKVIEDGTCGKGIYGTFSRYTNSVGIQRSSAALCSVKETDALLESAARYHGFERDKDLEHDFHITCFNLSNLGAFHDMLHVENNYDVLIFEGSQGLLLDMDCGFFPHVTPSNVGLNGVPERYLKDAEVFLVTRTYTTRHGNGYKPRLLMEYDLSNKFETNVNNKFQGEFKTGMLEVGLLNSAYERHCLDNYKVKYNMKYNLVITHMDVAIEQKKFKTEGYSIRGNVTPRGVWDQFASLMYFPDKVLYNDSVESNLKEL